MSKVTLPIREAESAQTLVRSNIAVFEVRAAEYARRYVEGPTREHETSAVQCWAAVDVLTDLLALLKT